MATDPITSGIESLLSIPLDIVELILQQFNASSVTSETSTPTLFNGQNDCVSGRPAGGLQQRDDRFNSRSTRFVPFPKSGLGFAINGQEITPNTPTMIEPMDDDVPVVDTSIVDPTLRTDGNYDFSLVTNKVPLFVGGLIRVETEHFTLVPSPNKCSRNCRVATTCARRDNTVQGVMLVNDSNDNDVSREALSLTARFVSRSSDDDDDDGGEPITIDVTVVLTNSTEELTYTYAQYTLRMAYTGETDNDGLIPVAPNGPKTLAPVESRAPSTRGPTSAAPATTTTTRPTSPPILPSLRPTTKAAVPVIVEECIICGGSDWEIGLPNAKVTVNDDSMSCDSAAQMAQGLLDYSTDCDALQTEVWKHCGCRNPNIVEEAPSPAISIVAPIPTRQPVASALPTSRRPIAARPIATPTNIPIADRSRRPTRVPINPSVVDPSSPSPTQSPFPPVDWKIPIQTRAPSVKAPNSNVTQDWNFTLNTSATANASSTRSPRPATIVTSSPTHAPKTINVDALPSKAPLDTPTPVSSMSDSVVEAPLSSSSTPLSSPLPSNTILSELPTLNLVETNSSNRTVQPAIQSTISSLDQTRPPARLIPNTRPPSAAPNTDLVTLQPSGDAISSSTTNRSNVLQLGLVVGGVMIVLLLVLVVVACQIWRIQKRRNGISPVATAIDIPNTPEPPTSTMDSDDVIGVTKLSEWTEHIDYSASYSTEQDDVSDRHDNFYKQCVRGSTPADTLRHAPGQDTLVGLSLRSRRSNDKERDQDSTSASTMSEDLPFAVAHRMSITANLSLEGVVEGDDGMELSA